VEHTRRPSAYFQSVLMLVALLSAVMLGGVQESACAMHGLGAAAAPQAGMSTMATAPSDAAGASHDAGGHSHDMGDAGCDCTCIGDCSMAAPLATPPAIATLRIALVDPEPRRRLDSEPRQPPTAEPDRLLPFANGPPSLALL
jgi:hypothetical protein